MQAVIPDTKYESIDIDDLIDLEEQYFKQCRESEKKAFKEMSADERRALLVLLRDQQLDNE